MGRNKIIGTKSCFILFLLVAFPLVAQGGQTATDWVNQGVALDAQGKYDDGIQACDKAITLNPNLAEAWAEKGFALNAQGKYDDAIQVCDKAIAINPQLAVAWNNKGAALFFQNMYDDAIQALDQAIALNPQLATAWGEKGFALNAQGKYDDAIQALDQAIAINPQYADAWYSKGNALHALGQTAEANDAFAKAKELGYNVISPMGNTITVVPSNTVPSNIMGNVIQLNVPHDPLLQEVCDNTGDPWSCGMASKGMLNTQDRNM